MKGQSKKTFYYALVLLVAGIIVLTALLLIPEKEKKEEDTPKETSAETVSFETADTPLALELLEVQKLIKSYYSARTENDAARLNELVDSEREFTVTDLASETQFIDRYDDFTVYTVKNEAERFFVSYVTYSVYFKGIGTGAPAMNRFVIRQNADGTYRIFDREYPETVRSFLLETEEDKTVKKMTDEVTEGLRKAEEKDAGLKKLMEFLSK